MTKQNKPKKKNMTLHSTRPDPYSLKDWRPTDFKQRKYTPLNSGKKPKPYKPPKFKSPEYKAVPSTELIPKKRRRSSLRKNATQGDAMRDMRTSKHFKGGLNPKKRRRKK